MNDTVTASMEAGVVVEVVMKCLIYVVGLVGNLLVIFLILMLREDKKVSHWYVLQLAIADFIFLQTLPFKISEDIHNGWIYSEWACQANQTVLFFNYYSSIMFLTIMAVDRFLAVCHGLTNRVQRWRSNKYAYVVTACVWIIALLMCIPVILYSRTVGSAPNCKCTIHFPKDPVKWCRSQGINETDGICLEFFHGTHKDSCYRISTTSSTDNSKTIGTGESGYGTTDNSGSGSTDNSGGGSTSYDYTYDFYKVFDTYEDEVLKTQETSGADAGSAAGPTPQASQGPEISIDGQCVYNDERLGWNIFLLFNFVAMFLIPLIIIAICYTMIILRLTRAVAGARKSSEKKRVTVMCGVLVLLFIVCWLPFHSVHLAKIVGIRNTGAYSNLCTSLATVTGILAYVNSALNPYLYNFLGTFKKRVRQVREHSAVRTFLSATGLTKIGGRSSVSAGAASSSEGTRAKHTGGIETRSSVNPEHDPLKATYSEKEM